MANNQILKDAITAVIKENGNNEITGPILQSALLSIVNQLGQYGTFAGVATPSTNPGNVDNNIFYLASQPGNYVNFNGFVVSSAELVVFTNYSGSWTGLKVLTDLTGDVQRQIDKIESVFVLSNNLFFNADMLPGSYALANGVPNPGAVNWIRTNLIPLDPSQTELTASGFGVVTSSNARFVFYGPGGVGDFISSVAAVTSSTAPRTVTIPTGAAFVAVNVANEINIGLDPTNSAYANTFMLNYGPTALPWETGFGIDGSKIIGVQPELQETIDKLDDLKTQFESVTVAGSQLFDNDSMMVSGSRAATSGVRNPSNINWITTTLIPLASGQTKITASGFGGIPVSQARFLFYDASETFISAILAEGPAVTASQTANIPTGAAFVAVNVANVIDIGLDPINSAFANTFMLNYGETALPWEEFNSGGTFLDGTKIKGLVLPELENPMQFISYNATTKSFKHYQRDNNVKDCYYMFEVKLNSSEGTTADPIIYKHIWEVTTAKKCVYDSVANTMTEQLDLIVSGESEFVFMCEGITGSKVDHTGGIHGDERIDKDPDSFIWPFIDGKKVTDLDTNIPLQSCGSFCYAQRSTLHETAEYYDGVATGLPASGAGVLTVNASTRNFEIDGVDTGVVAYSQAGFLTTPDSNQTVTEVGGNWVINRVRTVIAGHPIIGEHYKITYFENQGYRTVNTLVTAEEYEGRDIVYWYHGIYCLHKNAASIGFNEEFTEVAFTGTTNNFLEHPKNREFKAYNPTTGLSAEVTSRIIVESTNCKDSQASMFIWDRASDSKYYRQTARFAPVTGEKQISEMIVKYEFTNA